MSMIDRFDNLSQLNTVNKPDHQNANARQSDGLAGIVRSVFNAPHQGTTEQIPILDTVDADEMVEHGDDELSERRL